MGHHCSYQCRFYIDNNDLILITTATWKNKSMDIYREYLKDNKAEIRNVNFTYLSGYTVTFPDEKIWRYGKEIMGVERWGSVEAIWNFKIGEYYQTWDRIKTMLLEVMPELKYFCNKYSNDAGYSHLFEVIRNYLKHPESETLLELGCVDLAMNQSLYKLTKPKLKEVIRIVSDNKDIVSTNLRLRDIQTYIKQYQKKMSFKDFWMWYVISNERMVRWSRYIDYEDWKYINKQIEKTNGKDQITKNEYYDYIEMAKKVGHDVNDPYWKYPSNFRKMHNLVMEQVRSISAAKLALQQDFLKIVCKSMLKYNSEINGYKIFIPVEAIEWQKTCDVLYQCLIRNGYMKKVINQESIIVFVWKDNEPLATCEIDYKKNILQFYGDERGHTTGDSCKPSDEVIEAFNIWLDKFKPKKEKFKIDNSMHYYKGFSSFEKDTFHTYVGSMDGKGKGSSFVIGRVYETPFDDEEIIEAGGKRCVGTNKVFHFCSSITEISRHFSPSVYAEIRPLGAIVEHDGALLSNKIEVIRMIKPEEVNAIMQLEATATI